MGVDYRANYGFGVKVTHIPTEVDQYKIEALEYLLEDSPYTYFEVGSAYDDDETDVYIINDEVINELLKDNGYYCIESYAEDMKEFLKLKGIEYNGVPNIVGGLYIS